MNVPVNNRVFGRNCLTLNILCSIVVVCKIVYKSARICHVHCNGCNEGDSKVAGIKSRTLIGKKKLKQTSKQVAHTLRPRKEQFTHALNCFKATRRRLRLHLLVHDTSGIHLIDSNSPFCINPLTTISIYYPAAFGVDARTDVCGA